MNSFSIIGGDLRLARVANNLDNDGHDVSCFALESLNLNSTIYKSRNLQDVISNSNIIVLPLPATADDFFINTLFFSSKVKISEVFKLINKNQIVLAGMVTKSMSEAAQKYNVKLIDYLDREELSILNAIPTAEGAIQIAMLETPKTLNDSKILVMGFGRIGKVLSNILKGFNSNVTVAARKISDLAWIKSFGFGAADINNIDVSGYDIVFNTVPSILLTREKISKLNEDAIIIDLASKPGGVDFDAAKELNSKVIWALSLPGKVAPYTAGDIIYTTIINIIKELEAKNE